jgi:hypothetical protein
MIWLPLWLTFADWLIFLALVLLELFDVLPLCCDPIPVPPVSSGPGPPLGVLPVDSLVFLSFNLFILPKKFVMVVSSDPGP